MKRKMLSVVLAIAIVLSSGIVAAIVANKEVLTAIGQTPTPFNPYEITPTETPTPTPTSTPIPTPTPTPTPTPPPPPIVPGPETPADPTTDTIRMEADGIITYESEGFRVVHDTNTDTWWFEWDLTNNLDVPITIQPYVALYGCDVRRTGTEPNHLPFVFAGAAEEASGCPARGPSQGSSLTSATSSAVAGVQDSTVTLNFQSTLNIPAGGANATNKTIVGKSVRDKYLSLHPEANKTRANATVLKQRICTVDSMPTAVVNGTATTLQPGESMTVRSVVDSSDWGFACTPVNRGLINYNVNAGTSSYKGLTVDQTIVFGNEESNLCG